MYLTETDMIHRKLRADSQVSDGQILRKLIEEDIASKQKANMADGERYYVGEHDVLAMHFNESWISEPSEKGEGEERQVLFRNPNRSDHHTVNAFHKILVDQKVSYILGREPTISVKGAEEELERKQYEALLCGFADDRFNEVLQDLVTGASNKGWEALHVYYDKAGNFRYCIVPASELILIYDTEHEEELEQVIRYYDIVVVEGKNKKIRKRVEWWTPEQVAYYVETDQNQYVLDTTYEYNPSPHFWEVGDKLLEEPARVAHSWGRVPFIILKNNSKMTTDLQAIKGLIDAYDAISSEGTNHLLDLVELYWVIEGYGGETASAIAKKIQINKAVHISDPTGKVEAKQVQLPVEGRLEYLKMLRRDIFHFGQGIDADAEKFGTAPSGVSLKFQYIQLDFKANVLAAKLKGVIRELLDFVTQDFNRRRGTAYDSKWIEVSINKTMITNDPETVTMIEQSRGLVSEKTLLSKHPFVFDVNAEVAQVQEERAAEALKKQQEQAENTKEIENTQTLKQEREN